MWRDASQPSIAAWSVASAGTELSVFEQHLPQDVQSLSVEVPRGLRVHGSRRLAGETRGGAVKVRARKYDVTVEPNGRMKKAKDAIREAARHRSDIDVDLERHRIHDPSLDGGIDDRFVFRRERVKRFQVGSHFPALVSPRLVPSWRLSSAGQSSVTSPRKPGPGSPRTGNDVHVDRPTASHTRKQQEKLQGPLATPWLVSGASEATGLICDRKPALYADDYDPLASIQREQNHEQKSLWVGEYTMLPTSTAGAKSTCEFGRPQLESHVAAMRERGRVLTESLRERYEIQRDAFQRERDMVLEEQGCLSSFEQSVQKRRAAELARKHQMEKERAEQARRTADKKDEHPMAGLKGLAGLRS